MKKLTQFINNFTLIKKTKDSQKKSKVQKMITTYNKTKRAEIMTEENYLKLLHYSGMNSGFRFIL